MTISSVSSSNSLIEELLAIQSAAQAQQSASSATALLSSGTDETSISGPGAMMSKLQQLQKSDPEKFQAATQKISEELAKAAEDSDDPEKAKALNALSDKFAEASGNGDVSALAPPPLQGAQAGGHGHKGGYGRNGKIASSDDDDLFGDVNGIISSALSSVLGSTSAATQVETVDAFV